MMVAPIYSPPKTVQHRSEQVEASLAGVVEAALWAYSPLRTTARIEATELDGRVTLAGHVRSSTHRAMAARLTAAVPGVTEVENLLVADSELEAAVARALAVDTGTSGAGGGLTVKSLRGEVVIGGRLESPGSEAATARAERAGAVAAAVPGVRRVIVQVRTAPRGT